LNIRILQLLRQARLSNTRIQIFDLMLKLNRFNEWSGGERFIAINNLMNFRKRLLYVDGVSIYENEPDLRKSLSDWISITQTGMRYLDTLLSDLQYVQSCFTSMDWSIESLIENAQYLAQAQDSFESLFKTVISEQGSGLEVVLMSHKETFFNLLKYDASDIEKLLPKEIDYTSMIERLAYTRKCLNIIMYEDVFETLRYCEPDGQGKRARLPIGKELFSTDLICKLGWAVFRILRHEATKGDAMAELRDWLSLLIIADLWQRILTQQASPKAQDIIHKYGTVLHV
jgi:hypothetical protein